VLSQTKVLTMLLAGGRGERLYPLTAERSKPAVPFGGVFRIIDFTLMNCVLSGIRQVYVLTQCNSFSLNSHIQQHWSFLSRDLGEFIETVPPKLRSSTGIYKGTADAVFRNLDLLEAERPDVVLVLSGDHVYRADYAKLLEKHLDSGADVTVLCDEVGWESASDFGVVRTETNDRIVEFVEKPRDPRPYARNGLCRINLGVYCFNTRFLVQRLVEDAKRSTQHDFGRNILPESLDCGTLFACRFPEIAPAPEAYWRDVGGIDGYFQCHQDLLEDVPAIDLLDHRIPNGSRLRDRVPARVWTGGRIEGGWSLISAGAEVSRARIVRSVISPGVSVAPDATLDRCIVFRGVKIGAGAKIRNAIIDEGVVVPEKAHIGYGNDARRFSVSPGGVVVIAAGYHFLGAEEEESLRRLDQTLDADTLRGAASSAAEAVLAPSR
jgi:glucose-1-phosphate adenylyltransferase